MQWYAAEKFASITLRGASLADSIYYFFFALLPFAIRRYGGMLIAST
jgi:hypothetical protein